MTPTRVRGKRQAPVPARTSRGRARPGTRLPPQAVASHRRRSAFRLRDWRVRSKLAAVLIIPAVGFLVVAGVQVASSVAQARALATVSRQVALGRQITALVHELQRERDRTAGILAAPAASGTGPAGVSLADLAPDRIAVDRAAVALRVAAQPLLDDSGVRTAFATVQSRLDELNRVRAGVQAGWLRAAAAFDVYTHTIADLQAMLPLPATVGGDSRLGQAVRAFANLSRAKELTAQIRGRLFEVCTARHYEPGQFEVVSNVRAQRLAALERFRTDAAAPQLARYDAAVTGQAVSNATRLEQSVVSDAGAPITVDAQQWWQASTTQLELMRSVESKLLDDAVTGAAARSDQQWRSTAVGSALTLLLLGVATLTSLVIGRSMADSLRSLRAQALDVANYRLPKIIEQLRATPRGLPTIEIERLAVRTADEIGEMADAFTAVHRSAVRLAVEQALMRQNVNLIFVNLARRSQTLVERQLLLLDALESSETDPNQLDSLFRLDHLATRMRRNDENLLVLAGSDATRRWTEPVPLAAVVLAAAAEIEDYARVRHDITDDIYLAGHVVADLVHLVAELLENATVFSPPNTAVTVLGWAAPDGGAVLVIEDHGIGLSSDAVGRANKQLAAPVSLDIAAAERMGLVVVGHLADRHGIRVEMRSAGTGSGAVAVVALPARLLAAAPADAASWAAAPARQVSGEFEAVAEADRPAIAAPTRRAVPTRAEDVLGAARPPERSIWWSRDGARSASRDAAGRAAAAGPGGSPADVSAPDDSETGAAALGAGGSVPVVPGASGRNGAPPGPPPTTWPPTVAAPNGARAGANGSVNSAGLPVRVPMAHLPHQQGAAVSRHAMTEPDPAEVGSVLTRFYGGVHRAASENDDAEASA